MATADLQPLIDKIAANGTIIEGATTFILGVPALIQTAIDAAIEGGATAAQLAPVQAVTDDLTTKAQALQAAMISGTPNPPPAPPIEPPAESFRTKHR